MSDNENPSWHKKFLNRWADLFIIKHRLEGREKAVEYSDRTFTPELKKILVPIVQERTKRR